MPSFLSWLDYSDTERRQMLDVIDSFREQGTLDELGIGGVRDAFSDLFFPGISTIQTRARYFLFIPWIYTALESKRVGPQDIGRRARADEVSLINALAESGDIRGVIGIDSRSALKRLPSMVYWAGLHTWGIRHYRGSQSEYHRSLKRFYESADRSRRDDDGEVIGGRTAGNWHDGIPPAPEGFHQVASFQLTADEADYLRERIQSRVPRSLLAFLVEHGKMVEAVKYPWMHPQSGEVPGYIAEQLAHARFFSEIVPGSTILYNLMLAEQARNGSLADQYKSELADWWDRLEARWDDFLAWDRRRFWEIVRSGNDRVGQVTRAFVDGWVDAALHSDSPASLATDRNTRRLVHDREVLLKRGLSRLGNARARELWSGRSGIFDLDYRWQQAQVIISDILLGLGRENHA